MKLIFGSISKENLFLDDDFSRDGSGVLVGNPVGSRILPGKVAGRLPLTVPVSSTCTRLGSILTISGERDAPRWL